MLFFVSVSFLGLPARMIAVVFIVAMAMMAILLVVACSCAVWTATAAITIAEMHAIIIVERWPVAISSSIGASRLIVVCLVIC